MAYKIKNKGLEVKTKSGENVMGQDFAVEIKEHDAANRTFWCIGSTENPDRSNDIVRVEGWDLKNYKKAPRGLWAHDYYSLPIFKSKKVKINKETKQLQFQVEFDVYDFANLVYNQYINGFMSDFSVGFIGKEMEYRDEERPWSGGIDFKHQELLELSAVPVPDNPEAQKLGLSINNDYSSLIQLGYLPEFHFDEQKGIYWNPISKNLDAYRDPKLISISPGIKAVQAVPVFMKEVKTDVVGYYFDSENYKEEQIQEWLQQNAVNITPKNKYFSISLKDDKYDLELGEEEIKEVSNVENKETDVYELDMDDIDDKSNTPLDTDTNIDDGKSVAPDEKCSDCGKPKKECECKPPKKMIVNIVNENGTVLASKQIDGEEYSIEQIFGLFDKKVSDIVKLNTELETTLNEMKMRLEKLEENAVGKDNISNENTYEIDLSEFPPVSSANENSEEKEFEIESGDLETLMDKIVEDAENAVESKFKELMSNLMSVEIE